ncbi:MAG: DUF58 domain-containing protein, partial [Planctomycetes bacterium]|nr:DUF58 domain-containing protein [Planctomycetota bacterium]
MAAPRVSIRPSALGAKGLLLFAALELAFLATNYSNLFFLLLAFCAVLGAFGAWWSWRNLRGVHVADIELPMAAAGSARPVELTLVGDRRPRFDVTVELPTGEAAAEVGYAALLVGRAPVVGSLSPQPRGVQRIERVRLTSRYPFGFFEARCELPVGGEVVSHPQPSATAATGARAGGAGEHGGSAAGRGASLCGLREFRAGDEVADVHWKATARRGTAIVKEREHERRPAVEAVLDRRAAPEEFERALMRAAALVFAARHGAPLRLRSQDGDLTVDPDRGG